MRRLMPRHKLFRPRPKMRPEDYVTFGIAAPLATHWREATCREVNCHHEAEGWRTIVDEQTSLGKAQAHYIRKEGGRRFTENKGEDGLTVFTFYAGQRCFREHRVKVGRPDIFTRRGGDWRATTDPARSLPAHGWVDDFAEHQYKLHRLQKEG